MFKFDKTFRDEFRVNWLSLVVAFSFLLFGLSASAYALPFAFPEVIKEFGWTREQATLLATAKYVTTAISALVVGRLLDFVGVWKMLFATAILSGIGLLGFLWIHDLTLYYITGGVLGIGAGGGIVAAKVLVSKTFHASQGTAMGLALLGLAIGSTAVPILVAALISAFGWRIGLASLSLAVWVFAMPLLIAGYLLRDRGKPDEVEGALGDIIRAPEALDFAPQVLKIIAQRNFWCIALAVFGAAAVDTAFGQHQVLMLRDLNFSASFVALAISVMGLVGIASRVVVGNILDSSSNRGLAALYTTMTLACATAAFLYNPVVLVAFLILRAVAHAAVLLDTTVMSKHAYGTTKNLGTMLGIFTAASSIGFAVGPWLMGMIFDKTGSYNNAYALFGMVSVAISVLAWYIKPAFWLSMKEGKRRAKGVTSVTEPPIPR